jgi:hypothetical protein
LAVTVPKHLLTRGMKASCSIACCQHFGHLFRKLGIAVFQVVAHLVRLHFLLIENLADYALGQVGEAGMPLRQSMLAGVAGEKPRRPQFMRIAQSIERRLGKRSIASALGWPGRTPPQIRMEYAFSWA